MYNDDVDYDDFLEEHKDNKVNVKGVIVLLVAIFGVIGITTLLISVFGPPRLIEVKETLKKSGYLLMDDGCLVKSTKNDNGTLQMKGFCFEKKSIVYSGFMYYDDVNYEVLFDAEFMYDENILYLLYSINDKIIANDNVNVSDISTLQCKENVAGGCNLNVINSHINSVTSEYMKMLEDARVKDMKQLRSISS